MRESRQILSVSGISSRLAPSVYKRLTERLPVEAPEHIDRFVFLGSPFAQSGYSFPLDLTEPERCLHVTTRLLKCWVDIDNFNHTHLIPALERGKIPIILRYGQDAYLYARICCDPSHVKVIKKLENAHDALVQLRIIEEEIPPPQYLIPWIPQISVIEKEKLTDANKGSDSHGIEKLRGLKRQEEKLINEYCKPSKGQKLPYWLEGQSVEGMCDEAIRFIIDIFEGRSATRIRQPQSLGYVS